MANVTVGYSCARADNPNAHEQKGNLAYLPRFSNQSDESGIIIKTILTKENKFSIFARRFGIVRGMQCLNDARTARKHRASKHTGACLIIF